MSYKAGSGSKLLAQRCLNETLDPNYLTRDSVSKTAYINFLYFISSCTSPSIGKSFISQESKSKDPFLKRLCSCIINQDKSELHKLFLSFAPLQIKTKLLELISSHSLGFIDLNIESALNSDLTIITQEVKHNLENKELLIITIQPPTSKANFFSSFSKLEAIIPKHYTVSKLVLTRDNELFFYSALKNKKFEVFKGFQNTIINTWQEFLVFMIESNLVPDCLQIEKCQKGSFGFQDKVDQKLMAGLLSIYFGVENETRSGLNSSQKFTNFEAASTDYSLNEIKSLNRLQEIDAMNKLSGKSWLCPDCNSQNMFSSFNCGKCAKLNKILSKLSKLNENNLCTGCKQPAIRSKCRKCLSLDSENALPISAPFRSNEPLHPKPYIPDGYGTVQVEEKKSPKNNPYSTVSSASTAKKQPAEETKTIRGRAQNFNSKIRSSSNVPSKAAPKSPKSTETKNLVGSSSNSQIQKFCEICKSLTKQEICQSCKTKGHWKCSACGFNNLKHKNFCEVCDKPNKII